MPRRKKTLSETEESALAKSVSEATAAETPSRRPQGTQETLAVEPETAQSATTAEPTTPKRRRKRAAVSEPPTVGAEPQPSAAAEAPPKRTRRKRATAEMTPAESTVALEAVPAAEAPPAEPTAASEATPVAAETKPKRTRRKRATTETPPPETAATEVAPSAEPETAAPEAPPAAASETAATPEATPAPEQVPTPKRTRRRKRAQPAEEPTAAAEPAAEPTPEPAAESAVTEVAPAKAKRERRRKTAEPTVETPTDGTTALLEAPPAVAEPEIPPPPPIRHPIAQVQFQHGVPTILFGERAFKPLLFFGNPHTPEAAVRVQHQMQLAAEAGIHLYSLLVTLPVRDTGAIEAFDQIRYWTTLARETNPEAHLLWRIAFAPVGKWQAEFPEAVIRFADGTIGGPSVCAERWWNLAKEQLVALVRLVEQEDEGSITLGYHLDYGEWFLPESGGYDTSEAALNAFREWLRRQYKNDQVVLRACWFNGEVTFSTATLPPFQPAAPTGRTNHFYHPRREGRWIDYHRFLSDIMARRILGLAQAVKEASFGRALVGVPYGYVLEWKHPYAGHFALSQLLRSGHIDFLSAPISYATRLPGELGALPVPVDSVHLHGKLFLAEEDYRTPYGKATRLTDPSTGHHLGSAQAEATPDDDYNPPLHTALAVQQVHMRSLAQSLTYAHGEMWMDLWGEGWLAHPDAWNAARRAQGLWALRERIPQNPPEVAVVVDPESTRYVRTGSPLIEQMVVQAREAVLRSGASVGFYLLEDIVRREFPPSRVVIFLNAWRMSRVAHEAIRQRLQRDGRVLVWLYASTLFHGHRDALANARETLGIAIARQPWASLQGTQIVNKAHPLARFLSVDKIGMPEPWEPSFYALAEECDIIGEYIDTGLPSLVVCDHRTWKAVFLGERRLTPEIVRALVRWAGGHIWLDTNDLVQVRYPWVHIHARRSGVRTLQFPMPLSVYDVTEGELVAESTMEHALYLQEGESRLLIAAPHEQLIRLLAGEAVPVESYFRLVETPEEPLVPSETAEPDWEEPVLEPIRLEESPFEPILDAEAAESPSEAAPEPHVVVSAASEPSASEPTPPRPRRRGRNNRRAKPGRSAPPADAPIIAVQWRPPTHDES